MSEVGLAGVGLSGGGKIQATVIEHNKLNKNKKLKKKNAHSTSFCLSTTVVSVCNRYLFCHPP